MCSIDMYFFLVNNINGVPLLALIYVGFLGLPPKRIDTIYINRRQPQCIEI